MNGIRDILEAWSDLWRYPELLVSMARASTGEDDTVALVKGLIDGIAAPRPPKESVELLISAGEFAAARRVLDSDELGTVVDAGDREELSKALDEARDRAADEVRARAVALEARARRAGLTTAMPGGVDDAIRDRRSDADSLLDEWEADICAAEAKFSDELRQRLAKTTEKSEEETTPQTRAWRASVQRCLDAREYDVARFLLDAGPTAATPVEPLLVPRRPPWPFSEPLAEVLEWYAGTRPAPPDFHDRWRHDPTDQTAASLVEVLSRIADEGFQNADSVRMFANCLDRFLGHDGPEPEVSEHEDWFETRLWAVADPRLPCLGASGAGGVRLWIPRTEDTLSLEGPQQDALGICFLGAGGRQCPARTIAFDTWTLLPLFADRDQEHRRLNFLRALGSRVELDAAIPPEIKTIPVPARDPAAASVFAAWVLDIVNVGVTEPAVVDLIVYYAGADPRLVLHLLRALFCTASSRRAALGLDDLERAWRGATFRDAARAHLLGPLDAQPLLRAVLGAALLMGEQPGSPVPVEDICFALDELSDRSLPEQEVRTALDRLVEMGILDALERGGHYLIPASGIGRILRDTVDDAERYVHRALERPEEASRA